MPTEWSSTLRISSYLTNKIDGSSSAPSTNCQDQNSDDNCPYWWQPYYVPMQSNGKDSEGDIEVQRHKQELHVITIVISVVIAVVVVAGVGGFILWRMRRQRRRKRDSEDQIIEKELSQNTNTDTSDDGSIPAMNVPPSFEQYEQHMNFNSLIQSNATNPAVPSAVSHSTSSEKELRDVMHLQSAPESLPLTMQDPSAPSVDDQLSDVSSVAIAGHSGGLLPASLATSLPPDTKLQSVNEEESGAPSQDWSDADRKDAALFSVAASEPTLPPPLASPSAPPAYYRGQAETAAESPTTAEISSPGH